MTYRSLQRMFAHSGYDKKQHSEARSDRVFRSMELFIIILSRFTLTCVEHDTVNHQTWFKAKYKYNKSKIPAFWGGKEYYQQYI